MAKDKPNIVFLLNDHQVHYRHGWDGGPKIQRPHFHRLASQCVVFRRAYCASPLCGPERRTLLTGLYPHNHGETHNDTNHPYDREVYLDTLAENGYDNYYYGKWHAGSGTAHDFHSEGLNYPSYSNPYTKPEYRNYLKKRGLPQFQVRIEKTFDPWKKGIVEGELYTSDKEWCNEHATGVMTTPKETHESFFLAALACEKLEQLARSGNSRPFSLRVDFWGPHLPYFVSPEFASMYEPEDIPVYGNFRDDLKNKPEIYRSEAGLGLHKDGKIIVPNPLPWSEWQKVLARSYAHSTMVDAAGGMVLDALDRLGLADNTLVLWTTDHGDALACHGGHTDKSSYMPEEMIRVPMAVRYPERIPAGLVCDELVGGIDVAPTILDAAGTSFTNPVDGKSVLPLCTDESTGWRKELLCETHGHYEQHKGRLIVTDRYKYVSNGKQMDELYDLVEDPYELNNLIDDPGQEAVLSDLRARLRTCQDNTHDPSIRRG